MLLKASLGVYNHKKVIYAKIIYFTPNYIQGAIYFYKNISMTKAVEHKHDIHDLYYIIV